MNHEISPREAAERWLDKRRPELRESTISSLWYRLKIFVEWCDQEGIETVSDVSAWDVDEFEIQRRSEAKPLTLNKELGTLKQWLEYCSRIGLVDDDVPATVTPPSVQPEERSDDSMLEPEAGERLLEHYRSGPNRGSRSHAVFDVLWTVGCRANGIVALDRRDLDLEEQLLEFHHRPETGTGLKNGPDGERYVGLLKETVDALRQWLQERPDRRDEHGREPPFPSREGRPTTGTIRDWMYLGTVPCAHSPCPHGKNPKTCEFLSYSHASKCPSSRSPHQIRTGSITWQRSRGVPVEVVAERVNASVETIEQYYDKEDPRRELEERRRDHLQNLSLRENDTE